MSKRILFLTNLANGAPEEDEYLIEHLKKKASIDVAHPLECIPLLESIDSVIIRNIWPTYIYANGWKEIKRQLEERGIHTYNPLTGNADIRGKGYLLDLYKADYPVIPSIDSLEHLELLPATDSYWIKPKESCDGVGSKQVAKNELFLQNLQDYIIQPYIEFEYEIIFFFIDNVFSHALRQRHRLHEDEPNTYELTSEDLEFAQRFVEWNTLPYGIQRVDAVRLRDGRLLLTEVEDIAPYLYLLESNAVVRDTFTSRLLESIENHLLKD